jgi:hypothetical protein
LRLPRDILAGLVIVAVGTAFLIAAQRLRVGTLMNMGPGYFPRIVAIAVIIAGVLVAVQGWRNAAPIARPHLRPLLAISSGIALFALVLGQFGLIPATIAGVLAASAGDSSSRPLPALVVALGAGISVWLVFRVGLGLQMPGLRWPGWL